MIGQRNGTELGRLSDLKVYASHFYLQVSTKTGLDSTGAWHAWGMACLKAGNLTAAREKFSRCLKPPLDLNQLSHGSRLVQDVVEYLESTVRPLVSLVRAKQRVDPVQEEAGDSRIQGEDWLNPISSAFGLILT